LQKNRLSLRIIEERREIFMCFWLKKKKQNPEETPISDIKKEDDKTEIVEPTTMDKKGGQSVLEDKKVVKNNSKIIQPEENIEVKKGTKTKKVTPDGKKVVGKKQYIVQKSPTNKKKWEVIIKGGVKALKLFDTEVEASEYAKVTAKNQGASTIKRASKGEKKGKFIAK